MSNTGDLPTKPKKVAKYGEDVRYLWGSQGMKNAWKIYTKLKEKGYEGSYMSVNRYIKNFKKSYGQMLKRFETQPGDQAQVDWGFFGTVKVGDRLENLYCFVFILGYSRMMYAEFTTRQDLQTLQECHIHAFEMLGVPKAILYDNMKTVVLNRQRSVLGIERIILNPAILDFAQYYGFKIDVCPPYWPRSKGKVESGVKYIRRNFAAGLNLNKRIETLTELNKKLSLWLDEVANFRIHRTTDEKPVQLWIQERKYLRFIDEYPAYTTSHFCLRYSTKYGFIQYKNNFYSVPFQFARKKLLVREISESGISMLNIYHGNNLLCSHPLCRGKKESIGKDSHFEKRSGTRSKSKLPQVSVISLDYYTNLI